MHRLTGLARVSRKLLVVHRIPARLTSYHKHNAERLRPKILARLRNGDRVVLISDAGTPAIADPGYKPVEACHDAGVVVSTVPGPTALIAALTISGLWTDRFYFGGFLPAMAAARRSALAVMAPLDATLVYYESPKRLSAALADTAEIFAGRPAAVCWDLTKLHQEIRRGTLGKLRAHYGTASRVTGEAVILIGPRDRHDAGISDAELDTALGPDPCTGSRLSEKHGLGGRSRPRTGSQPDPSPGLRAH